MISIVSSINMMDLFFLINVSSMKYQANHYTTSSIFLNHDESNELIRVKIVNSVELLLVYDRKNNIFGNC